MKKRLGGLFFAFVLAAAVSVVLGVIQVESCFYPEADNGRCCGLMQLNRDYFPDKLSPVSLPEKTLSVEFGGGAEKKQITTMANPASGANLYLRGDSAYNTVSYCQVGKLYLCTVTIKWEKEGKFCPLHRPIRHCWALRHYQRKLLHKGKQDWRASALAAGPAI